MGNLDSVSKVFVQKPDVFRDVFKLVLNDKRTIMDEMMPMEPEMLFVKRLPPGTAKTKREQKRQKMRKAAWMAKFTRDIIKDCVCATDELTDYMLLAIENQSYVDGLMPARVMIYDAMTFHIQMEVLKAQTRAQKTSDAFLTGVPKGVKLKPVITAVCYFGTNPWDGPSRLHEILEIHDPELKKFIPDYPIHIIDPHRLTDEQMQCIETSLREVFLCLKASSHSKSLKEIVNSSQRFQHMDPDAMNLINTVLDIDIPIDYQKKENNMCQAVEDWKQELLDEGYANGEKAILKTLIQNSGLSLSEIAQITQQPLAVLQNLAAQ